MKAEREHDPQTYAIIGAALAVHNCLGHGFLEAVYQEALAIELLQNGVPYEREVTFPIFYRGKELSCQYRADFVCFGDIIVELKAITTLGSSEQSQLLNYLKASGKKRGLLLNFGSQSLQFKRLAL